MKVTLVGGGALGRRLASELAADGARVTVLAPRRLELPGLWLQGEVVEGRGLRAAVRDADRVVWCAHRQQGLEELYEVGLRNVATAAQQVGARLVVVAPRGAAPDASAPLRAVHKALHASQGMVDSALMLPPLFGRQAHLLGPWIEDAEQGRALRVRRPEQEIRPLWIGDAASLVGLALQRSLGRLEVLGASTHSLGGLADRVCELTGARRAWLPGLSPARPLDLELLPEQLRGRDDWPEELPERTNAESFLRALLAGQDD